MSYSYWDMTYGDELKSELMELKSTNAPLVPEPSSRDITVMVLDVSKPPDAFELPQPARQLAANIVLSVINAIFFNFIFYISFLVYN